MQDVFNQTITLFIVMIIGIIVAKLNIFTHDVRKHLSTFLLNITAPMLILKNFQRDYSQDLLVNMGIVALVAFLIITIGLIAGYFVWRKAPEDMKPSLRCATAFPNCGYMGYPIIGGLFGSEGIIYVAITVMVLTVYMWTMGIKIFAGKADKWYKPFLRPTMIAVVLGLIMFVFSIKFPSAIYNSLDLVGSMTSPLAMLLVGSYIADSKLKEIFGEKRIYLVSLFKLVLWPTLTFFALKPFNLDNIIYTSCVLLSGMPVAVNTVILATRFNKNPKFSSELVAFTTLISVASIPVWIYLIGV